MGQNMYQQPYNRQNYEFHQMANQQQQQQRANQLTGRVGTGSVTSLHSLQSGSKYMFTNRPNLEHKQEDINTKQSLEQL